MPLLGLPTRLPELSKGHIPHACVSRFHQPTCHPSTEGGRSGGDHSHFGSCQKSVGRLSLRKSPYRSHKEAKVFNNISSRPSSVWSRQGARKECMADKNKLPYRSSPATLARHAIPSPRKGIGRWRAIPRTFCMRVSDSRITLRSPQYLC